MTLGGRCKGLQIIATKDFESDLWTSAITSVTELRGLGPAARNLDDKPRIGWGQLIDAASRADARRRSSLSNAKDNGNDPSHFVAGLPKNFAYPVLSAMAAHSAPNESGVYESLARGLVRRTSFLKGVVSSGTLPAETRPEIALVGRSNVGKSSLINMVLNRKALAYTSKTPGKTKEYNYFTVNDAPDIEKFTRYGDEIKGRRDLDSFYIVDMPGFGYAKVPGETRDRWREFTREFVGGRRTLRLVLHLVDSRHGLVADHYVTRRERGGAAVGDGYVLVLTKADKNDKTGLGKVPKGVMEQVREGMREAGVGGRPIIVTSKETKLGRDEVWRYIGQAVDPDW